MNETAASTAEARLKEIFPQYANGLPGHVFHFGIPDDTPGTVWEKLRQALAASPGVADVTRRGDQFEAWEEPLPEHAPGKPELVHVAVRVAVSQCCPVPLDVARMIADVARKAAEAAAPGLINWKHPNTILTDGVYEYEVGGVMDPRLLGEERDIHAAYSR